MLSGNDPIAPSSQTAEAELTGNEGPDAEVTEIQEGMYFITNKMARTVLNLPSSDSGRRCEGYYRTNNCYIGNQLWIIKQDSLDGAFTLKNFLHNCVLDLYSGHSGNGSHVTGYPRVFENESRLNQEWRVVKCVPHQYTIQCMRRGTFLEVSNGDPSNGAPITCSEASTGNHQIWDLERVSRSTLEVKNIIRQWKPALLDRLFQPYGDRIEYFVPPDDLRKSIWESAGLRLQHVREYIFDYDDFVMKAKEAVRIWARDQFPGSTHGCSVLFGIVYGQASKGPKGYNWYLTPDMSSLMFFDAQTGREYTPVAVDGFGFEPTLIMF